MEEKGEQQLREAADLKYPDPTQFHLRLAYLDGAMSDAAKKYHSKQCPIKKSPDLTRLSNLIPNRIKGKH